MEPVVGVLALQGAFAAHERALADTGVRSRQVRTVADLDTVDALVLPGGESTSMSLLLSIRPRLSRNHCTSAPAMAIEPSSA